MTNRRLDPEKTGEFVHAPFRYQGHITYALGSIISLVPEHESFVEPFCGGAGLFFAKPKAKANVLNDINRELVTTYKIIRDQPQRLAKLVRSQNNSERRYNYLNDQFEPANELEVALRWFYLNRTSEFETMDKLWERDASVPFDSAELEKIILASSQKLQGVDLTCGDFSLAINNAPDKSFVFVAPPYSLQHSPDRTRKYRHPFHKEAHLRLADTLKQNANRVNFMMAYKDCPEIRALYSWANLVEVLECDHLFTDDSTKKPEDQIRMRWDKDEVAIMNYSV